MIAKFQSGASQIRDTTPQGSLPRMEFGREICSSLANAEQRETMLAAPRERERCLSSRNGLGLAARPICSCAFACVQRPNPSRFVSRAVCKSCA